MPLPPGAIYLPTRYTSEDLAQQANYQSQIDKYNKQYDEYKAKKGNFRKINKYII